MIRVLIADDHPVVRSGLQKILSREPEIGTVDEAQNGAEALELARTGRYDVLVLDITMPDKSGLEIAEQLKREGRKPAILFLSIHKEELFALKAFKVGAAGYLTKESVPTELVLAVKKVASGGKYVSPHFAETIVTQIDKTLAAKPPHETLSTRELEIMLMIASGLQPKAIANKLFLSVKTINEYRMRILAKMNMKTNAELIRYCLENRLIQ